MSTEYKNSEPPIRPLQKQTPSYVLDGQLRDRTDKAVSDSAISLEQDTDIFGKMLDRALEQKFHEIIQELQKVLAEQIRNSFSEYVSTVHSDAEELIEKTDAGGMGQTQEPELSEDM